MPQSSAELRRVLQQMKEFAARGHSYPDTPPQAEFRLTTVDSPAAVSFKATAALVDYTREKLGVELDLCGGGFGCFDMSFAVRSEQTTILEDAILTDLHFQSLLNVLNTHIALVRTQGAARTYSAFYEIMVALATNRERQSGRFDAVDGVSELFGGNASHEMHYGLVTVLIFDLSKGQGKENMVKRAWRRVSFDLFNLRAHRSKVVVQKIDLMKCPEFERLVTAFAGQGAIVMVHGYANSFDDAVRASAFGAYKGKLHQLQLLPILFSWPSRGAVLRYAPDIKAAENSEYAFQDLLRLVTGARKDREIDILAHSHGNKILVRALSSLQHSRASPSYRLKHLILVEPDIDQVFLSQRVGQLAETSEHIVIYHSENDLPLRAASSVFGGVRVGQYGLPQTIGAPGIIDQFEVIDASRVARGLSKHAPHLESPEVISDIYHLLCGMKPNDRFHLRLVDARLGRWQVMPS
jgi:esterase/lipase superfamily enzyme